MAEPTPSTYNSLTNLNLGSVPRIDDPVLYQELLDIHNALESLLKSSDTGDLLFTEFVVKQRSISIKTADYTIVETDGTILIDASINAVTITLPLVGTFVGYRYHVKCIDDTFGAFAVTQSPELLEASSDPFELFDSEYIDVKNDGLNWLVTG